jgi:predicted kinase
MSKGAIESIQNGQSVILDATFSIKNGRQRLIRQLEEIGAKYLFIEAVASDETIKARLKKRDDSQTISDARLEDFEMLTERYDKPDEVDKNKLVTVDTGKKLSETIGELYNKLIELQMVNQDIF